MNRLVAELEALGAPGLGFPRQGGASADLRAAAAAANDAEHIALWAGQAGGLAREALARRAPGGARSCRRPGCVIAGLAG